jgi:hypothetical protein
MSDERLGPKIGKELSCYIFLAAAEDGERRKDVEVEKKRGIIILMEVGR